VLFGLAFINFLLFELQALRRAPIEAEVVVERPSDLPHRQV
jgi:hypothetical protein